ncbi:hypothetical protein BGZ63DRAFT_444178 [Mariannaea sp. PMI_226]|nr:hypothetical protein BGZ63DRAFT_444178 [Mariannaea sp. PMI_226]
MAQTTPKGTTNSGVAYAFVSGGDIVHQGVITEWPGAGNTTRSKVPTTLYYDSNQKVVGWGTDFEHVLTPFGVPKAGIQKVEWFKLQLMAHGNSHYGSDLELSPLPPGKSDIDVIADCLSMFHEVIRDALQKDLGRGVFSREESKIKYSITVPGIWTDAAKAALRQAVFQAGFLKDVQDPRLTIVPEPEAAVIERFNMGLFDRCKWHDVVLVINLGGGIVDLCVYGFGGQGSFTIQENALGSGDSCGASALNRSFSNYLQTKIRKMNLPDGSVTASKVYTKCMIEFDSRIKVDFARTGKNWVVDVGLEKDYPDAGIEGGYMTFSDEEISQCFDPVLFRILELVRSQILNIQSRNYTLAKILVVGEFGNSEYFLQQIKSNIPPQHRSGFVRPSGSDSAIARGAVTASVAEKLVTERCSRRHYIVVQKALSRVGQDAEDTRVIIVSKGQQVKCGAPIKVSFVRQVAPGSSLIFEDILYSCDEETCPKTVHDRRVKQIATLASDLSHQKLENFQLVDGLYLVNYDIWLTLDGSELKAELVCAGEHMGLCQTKFA